MTKTIDKKFIPLDKSWIIRMGILDLVHGYDDIETFLDGQKNLGDDLLALKSVSRVWKSDKPVDVGESGTLYRLLKFVAWKQGLNKNFIIRRTLKERNITDDPHIVAWPIKRLLKLDNNTSQWATAALLLGNKEKIQNPPYKLALTYKAVSHWKKQRKLRRSWIPKYDETISDQSKAFIGILSGKKMKFVPKQAEDFCFAYTFGYISMKEGEKKWPSLRGHESDRIVEMEKSLDDAKSGKEIKSRDHRVIQALGMWALVNNKKIQIKYPESVNKSWPQFWDFIESAQCTRPNKTNITLIGMPGSEKSYVGKILSKNLGYKLIELDKLMEEAFKLPLQAIVNEIGEKKFLKEQEKDVFLYTNTKDDIVISPGGSIIYSSKAMKQLKKSRR